MVLFRKAFIDKSVASLLSDICDFDHMLCQSELLAKITVAVEDTRDNFCNFSSVLQALAMYCTFSAHVMCNVMKRGLERKLVELSAAQ